MYQGDIITMVLERWPYHKLRQACLLFIKILERPAGDYGHFVLDSDERKFAESHFIPYIGRDEEEEEGGGGRREIRISYRAYFTEIYSLSNPNECTDEDVLKLRACFLIGLVYDVRIRRFCLLEHFIHDQIGSKPVDLIKLNRFIQEIEPLICSFLDCDITLDIMTNSAVDEWKKNFMFH
jgi:hypothetical protein